MLAIFQAGSVQKKRARNQGVSGHEKASTALGGREVAGGDLVFVGGEGCQDFALLLRGDLGEVQLSPEFGSDLIEFRGGDPEVPVGLLKAERRLAAGLGGRELEGTTRNVAHPERPHELEAGEPF